MPGSLAQQYSAIRTPAIQPGTGNTVIALLCILLDILVSAGLYQAGYSVAIAHNAGFISTGILLLLLRLIAIDKSAQQLAGDNGISKSLAVITYFIIQSAIRAGCIASMILLGLDSVAAVASGIVLATLLGSYSSALFLSGRKQGLGWQAAAIALIVCIVALRLVFLGSMEVIPQEAYYWNYAQHLAPGYLDHPPLVAATIWTGEFLFGHNAFGTRFGAFIYGLLFIFIFYRYARLQVDRKSALLASAFAMLLPYFFMATGFLITPDAPLTVGWVMALFFFYQALVNQQDSAWYGVGLAIGIGMLSKYTIALMAPAALLFILVDASSRRLLLRKEPYIAVIISLLVFSPVIYWNATNDWASFAFQGGSRFDDVVPEVWLGTMLTNILAMVTPLPLLALPYLFTRRPTTEETETDSPFGSRQRLFIASFLLVPMSVFAWNALSNEPRYNWTGPLWITMLPMLAWLTVNAGKLRWPPIAVILKKISLPMLVAMLCIYAILLQFLTIGLPSVPFPGGTARLLGWGNVARDMLAIQQQLPQQDKRIVVMGRDKYFITAKLAYHGTPAYLGDNNYLDVTGHHLIEDNSLMFAFWNPAEEYRGATVIMLGRSKGDLGNHYVQRYFDSLSPEFKTFPIYKDDFGQPKKTIREYYYRIGYGYRPPEAAQK